MNSLSSSSFLHSFFIFWILLFQLGYIDAWLQLSSIPNLRPVVAPVIYRSAALDQLSSEDAQQLASRSITLIDLRNTDEQGKALSEGAEWFYKDYIPNNNTNTTIQLIHIPILRDTNRFWDAAVDRLDASTRWSATLQTIWQAGALDRAAARYLEHQGHAALYTLMLETAAVPMAQALNVCMKMNTTPSSNTERVVLFHCQKGKDRTGLVAALLQHILGCEREQIIADYALTEELLDEGSSSSSKKTSSSSLIDWSVFRGSPASAMQETLEWVDQTYGSMDGYLESLTALDKVAMKEFQERHGVMDKKREKESA